MSSKGTVVEVKDGIIYATGLEDVGINELVKVYSEDYEEVEGIAINLDTEVVGILSLGDYKKIKQGDQITTTGLLASIKVNKNYLGRVIDPLGRPLDGKGPIDLSGAELMPLDKIAPGVVDRRDVDRPLQTGIIAVDSMIPVGRGQRELIIGDRQIGKTAIAIDTIINQKDKNCYCIYVAIGQKNSKTAQIIAKLEEAGALENTVIINSSSADPVAMEYLAPLTGTSIGEYFAEKGEDALIVYDDLSKHAQAYREISLLLKRPSGREAYPGDIFYLHSKLLERSVQFSDQKGGGSLTALPIVETQAGDVSAYIPTNIISITDGQIYLEQDLYNAGQRPAVSIGISVSRVGGAAQTKAVKSVSGQLKLDLAQYRELAAFAQFGSDLDKETKSKLDRGSKIMEIMKQKQFDPMSVELMSVLIFAANAGFLDEIDNSNIQTWVNEVKKETEMLKLIDTNQKVEGEIETKLKNYLEKFNRNFFKLFGQKDVE